MKNLLLILLCIYFPYNVKGESREITLYSSRSEHLIKPVLDLYKKETGIKINLYTGKPASLIEKILKESSNSKADIFMTVDAGNLWYAEKKGLFSKVKSDKLTKNIPKHLKSPNNKWFGLSMRARTIVYNSNKISPKNLSSYEDLASTKWKNKLCLRTSKKVYNQSLVSMMIAEKDEKQTEKVVKGWVANLVRPVFSSDTLLIQAIARGECQVGIANSYYLARQLKKDPNLPVKIFWSNQETTGVHVNISGAGIVEFSKKKKLALHFLEWLSEANAQKVFAQLNFEYPVDDNIRLSPIVATWGDFKASKTPLNQAGALQAKAIKLMDRSSYM